MKAKRPNSLSNEYLYGQPLYPVAPLSWLAPLWSFVCGVAASATWSWSVSSLLRLLSGLLLVGPLLGMAWSATLRIRRALGLQPLRSKNQHDGLSKEASTKTGRRESSALKLRAGPVDDPAGHTAQRLIPVLPYTLSGSASDRFAVWLSAVLAWWQRVKPRLSRLLLQLAVSTVFSLTVAAQLGQQSLALTTVGLLIAYTSILASGRWTSSFILSISIPLFLAWLQGHAVYNTLHLPSVFVAASFAFTFYSCSVMGKGLAWQVIPQAVAAAVLVAVKQPLAAAVITLLGTPQVLLAPLLETQLGREKYFRAVQFQLATSMFLTALAIGYKP